MPRSSHPHSATVVLFLLLSCASFAGRTCGGSPDGRFVALRVEDGAVAIEFAGPDHRPFRVGQVRPAWPGESRRARLVAVRRLPRALWATFASRHLQATVKAEARGRAVSLRLDGLVGPAPMIVGRVSEDAELYAARIVLKDGRPYVFGRGDVLEIGTGRVSSWNANCVYSTESFFGLAFETTGGTSPRLTPIAGAHTFCVDGNEVTIRCVDMWPVLGWRRERGWTGRRLAGLPPGHIVPREWMRAHRPFPWKTFSPVQLPYISMTDPKSFPQIKEQIDFLAENLRDYGFFCFGEWPLTQYYPEYDPALQPAWLEGNRRTCEYAHSRGIKILRWLTDPDIQPSKYPRLHEMMLQRGWFSHRQGEREWLLDYTNPEVQAWITRQYARLAATGPDFYWIDNNHPTRPIHDPTLSPPVAFRNFFSAIQRGLLSTGRGDILMRSGASAWADYAGVGILDVYAPGPDVQNDWLEQQIYVANKLAHDDYLDHFNLWRRCIDDYFPAGPQTIDQTRAMATLLALTGLGFTTTDMGLPNIPLDRLEMLRQVVPITTTRPLDLFRFEGTGLPHWWVLHVQRGDQRWAVAGVFNWGLRAEEIVYAGFDQLGLDPDREYLVYDFYSQAPVGVFANGMGMRVAPSSGRPLAIHPLRDRPFFVSTDRHITQGAAEIEDIRWDHESATLSGVFTQGVKGRTYHIAVYVPARYEVRDCAVGGKKGEYERRHPNLVRAYISCDGKRVPWSFTFAKRTLGTNTDEEPALQVPERKGVIVVRNLEKRTDWAKVARAEGKAVVLVSPGEACADLRRFQRNVGLSWGVYREPGSDDVWLTVGGENPELP
ncbi:MAG: TIM-barrel domain-containing protein, partial [Armatimonadota bacterium]